VGLAAAALVRVLQVPFDTTTLVRKDLGTVLAVLAAVYRAVVAVDDRRNRCVMAFCAVAGVPRAIQYSCVFAILPGPIAAVFGASMPERIRRALRAVVLFVLVGGLTNHFVRADFPKPVILEAGASAASTS
jgi:hypothetical protein